jgi:hypothetical protein
MGLLVVHGGDRWSARRMEFGRRGHAGVEQRKNWGKRELTGGPRLSVMVAR